MNIDRLTVHFLRGLFGRKRSYDLQKLSPLVWHVLKGIEKLQPTDAEIINKWQLRFTIAGQHYYARMRHISNRLPRRIELVKNRGATTLPLRFFTTLAQAQAFERRPSLSNRGRR